MEHLLLLDDDYGPSQRRRRIWQQQLQRLGIRVTMAAELSTYSPELKDVTHALSTTHPGSVTSDVQDVLQALPVSVKLVQPSALQHVLRTGDTAALSDPTHRWYHQAVAPSHANAEKSSPAVVVVDQVVRRLPAAPATPAQPNSISSTPLTSSRSSTQHCPSNTPISFSRRPYGCLWPAPLQHHNHLLVNAMDAMEWDRSLAQTPSADHKHRNTISALAYRRASMTLRCLSYPVTSIEQIEGLPFINDTITEAIDYVLSKRSLDGYPRLKNDQATQTVLSEFVTVWGAGPATAWEWYNEGYRNLEDVELAVRKRQLVVSEQVAVYLEHRAELAEAVTRRDIAGLQQWVTSLATELDESTRIAAVGGYRRGKHTAHDVDFLITVANVPSAAMLSHILEQVQAKGRLVYVSQFDVTFRTADAVAAKRKARASTGFIPSSVNFDDLSKKLCVVLHPETNKARRVDFVVCTRAQEAFALLGWTGNKMYNRELRRWADNHGYHLSSSGLWRLDTAADDSADNPIISIPATSEVEVLQALGLPYWPPEQRNH
eukprot:m.22235 g.22235  ORF g.22235 m.22235 type:complete len:546 (-) comp11220_c0_seq1:33-1670(-)